MKSCLNDELVKINNEHQRIREQIDKLNIMIDELYSYEDILNANVACWGKLLDIENNLIRSKDNLQSLISFVDSNINTHYVIGTSHDENN